jgi:hypothetical protein
MSTLDDHEELLPKLRAAVPSVGGTPLLQLLPRLQFPEGTNQVSGVCARAEAEKMLAAMAQAIRIERFIPHSLSMMD